MGGKRRLGWLVVLAAALPAGSAGAAEALVAVAANFTAPAQALGERFEAATGHRVAFSFGSTGHLYAQITQGAPFDAFLAADADRPARLEVGGMAVAGSRFSYALGRLVLWSRDAQRVDPDGHVLERGEFRRLAVANPATAPYGAAAVAVLEALALRETLAPKLVEGANVAQTFQFVATGNAELGFVALSQVLDRGGSRWLVPDTLYPPIRQQAVLLSPGRGNPAAAAFLEYLRGEEARELIRALGYEVE